ncbi:MAG TPA: N-acetylmuramoyl-L-alanine amidase [Mycobacteriales bacterium]|nr:N-acetylmuramoyl-L-alanine amidase [Mycobacteriales bacterium]
MRSRRWVVAGAAALCVLTGCTHRDTGPQAHPAGPTHSAPAPRNTPSPRPAARPVVVLDPGHNGGNSSHPTQIDQLVPAGRGTTKQCNTTGTATDAGYAEHAFDWDVALRVQSLLRGYARIVLTRPDDTGVGPCVDERAAIGNRARAAAVVSIHGDGSFSGHGFHVIRAAGDPGGQADRSRALAVAVHNQLARDTSLVPATYVGEAGYNVRSDLAGLNLSTRPSILVECGNMRDAGDAAILSAASGRQQIAQAIAAGIRAYLSSALG